MVLLNNHQLTGIDPSHIHEPDFEKEIVTLLTEGSPMLQWIKLYWLYEETIFSTKANGFLYFLTKIPLIGKHLPRDLYGQYGLKNAFTVLFSLRLILPFSQKLFGCFLLCNCLGCFFMVGRIYLALFDQFEEQIMIAGFILG